MTLPFSVEQFLGAFEAYNTAVWPAPLVLHAVGLALVAAAMRPPVRIDFTRVGLAFLWAWAGVVYHIGFFAPVNPAARLFGIAFCVQALLWLVWWRTEPSARFHPPAGTGRWVGTLLVAYALVGYPALNVAFGHRYPRMPTFGVPCPLTIATLGLLVWASPRAPWWIWVVPLGWAVVGSSAIVLLGIREDLGLPVAAVASVLARARAVPGGARP
jgi:hypothetical protein